MGWYEGRPSPPPPPQPVAELKLKNDLPAFESAHNPGPAYWEKFPFNPLPIAPSSVINWKAFQGAIDEVASSMSPSERKMAAQVVSDLKIGADTLVNTAKVPLELIPNKPMSARAALACGDQLATMVKKRHISGPFCEPPFPEFRANPLFVIERNGKLRIILDLSSPEDASLNDAIDSADVPDITMASPREIADLLVEFGSTAHLSKLDHCAAFKLVPVRASLIKYQGFQFMGKFFVETQLVFGSKSSPALYDRLHEVFLLVAQLRSKVPSRYLHRTLDDFVAVTPDKSTNERIVHAYMTLADEINLPLASLDDPDKAFILKQQGVILGIDLDAENTCWRIPEDKVDRHRRAFAVVAESKFVSKLEAERMLGMTQQVTNMLPVLKPLTFPLLEAVQRTHEGSRTPVTPSLLAISTIWLNIYHALASWQPISQPMVRAPLTQPVIGVFPILDDDRRHIGILSTGPTQIRFDWPRSLQERIFLCPATKLAYPHVYVYTLGVLCALFEHAKAIKDSHFTCFISSAILEQILRKGRDKRCRKTTTLIRAIYVTLIHLNAVPSFILSKIPSCPDALTVLLPEPVAEWTLRLRGSPEARVVQALINDNVVPNL